MPPPPTCLRKCQSQDELCNTGRINYALRSKHDKDGRTEEVNVKSCLGAENYGGHFQSSSDDSRRVNGQIVTDSDEKCGGNESFVSVALDGNTLTLSTEPSLLNSPARVNFSMSVGGDKSQMIEESRNCKLGTSLGTYKLVSDALKYGGGRKEHRQNDRSKRLVHGKPSISTCILCNSSSRVYKA